jgi:glutathione S-transferase
VIRLYGEPRSRAFRCIWMLEGLGLPYELIPIKFGGRETRTPEYLALNPNGKVPVLVDGPTIVWESLAINHYLALKYDGGLEPSSADACGEAYRWSFWAMGELEGPIDSVARLGAVLPADWAKPALSVLDAALAAADWLVERRFTVADLNIAVMFWRPVLARVDRGPFPNIERWLERCRARPAFRRMSERADGG